jgi:hypothetical protein
MIILHNDTINPLFAIQYSYERRQNLPQLSPKDLASTSLWLCLRDCGDYLVTFPAVKKPL